MAAVVAEVAVLVEVGNFASEDFCRRRRTRRQRQGFYVLDILGIAGGSRFFRNMEQQLVGKRSVISV